MSAKPNITWVFIVLEAMRGFFILIYGMHDLGVELAISVDQVEA